jgi:methionyl-tRNA formyltransferase
MKPRIVFFGTPDFAVASLNILIENGHNVVGVVTAPDKPSGRGKQLSSSPVKDYALSHNLPLLQPLNLRDAAFLVQLKDLAPELQVVVAFRMLPRDVWQLPPLGTFNLHASLLPQYRGAAPINWAIINGEKETGVTTFFIDEAIDTGKVIFSETVPITENESAGELHDRLMKIGAELVLKTVDSVSTPSLLLTDQRQLIADGVTLQLAPKISKGDCLIPWSRGVIDIHNFIRGMSPYPGAFTYVKDKSGNDHYLKIFKTIPETKNAGIRPGEVETDGKSYFRIAGTDGFLTIMEVQPAGRKIMTIVEFLNGFGKYFS